MNGREEGLKLLKKYNKEPFHIVHALTVEGVMRYFAEAAGEDQEYWGLVGLLHDIDFEEYPDKHCVAAARILKENGYPEDVIKAICSHGYGETETEYVPTLHMEKVLYAIDELTGLIGAAARMRPSKSTKDMELSSLKKKFKDKKFAAGCSREVIERGAEMLGMPLDSLLEETILAMRDSEDQINQTIEEMSLFD
jgi:putative nucleotidyltransferase with HDIG domain